MQFTSAEVTAWVGSYLWPLTRVAALLSVAPVFGAQALPRRVRLMLVLVLTWAVRPWVPEVSAVDPLSPAGIVLVAQQLLIGLVMGFVLRLAFGALEVGGQVIATQMGLSYASMVDPQNGGDLPLVSTFYQLTGTLVFLSLNGHLLLIQLLADSFQQLPVGATGIGRAALWSVAGWATHLFAGAVLVALPAIASLMVVNLAFAVMTRAAPQLNIFAVGLPITLLLGLVIILYGLPALLPQFERLLDGALQSSRALLP